MRAGAVFLVLALALTGASGARAHEGVGAELALLDAELASRPGDPELLVARAALLRRAGRLALALTDCDRALTFAPDHRPARVERGLVLAALGRAAEGEAELTRFLDGGPPSTEALVARAHLREAAGRLEEARADLDAAVRLGPTPDLVLERGRLDEATGHLERAARGYEEGLRALSGAWVVRAAWIRVERRRARGDKALTLVDEALAQTPAAAPLRLLRAEVLEELGRAAEARAERMATLAAIDADLRQRPTDLRKLTRARALAALGRRAEAQREVRAVLARSPALPEAREVAALVGLGE